MGWTLLAEGKATDPVGSHIKHDATLGTPNHSKTLVLKAPSAGRRYLVDRNYKTWAWGNHALRKARLWELISLLGFSATK